MSITARQVNTFGTRVFMGTLTGGVELHTALVEAAVKLKAQTATFALLGGLHEITFAAYDFNTQTRLAPLTFTHPMEIVAGHGTISLLDGNYHVHVHLVAAFRDESAPSGMTIVGGHVAHARVYAVEFTLTAHDGIPVERAEHPATGLKLWDLPKL